MSADPRDGDDGARFAFDGVMHIVVSQPAAQYPELTCAEAEVVQSAVRGASESEIAAERGVSPRTVHNQLQSSFRKLGVRSRSELIALDRRRAAPQGKDH